MSKSFGKYDNGIPKRLCDHCPYMKTRFGRDNTCKLYNKDDKVLGIYSWLTTPHPKCPLAIITYEKLIKLAHYYRYNEKWAWYIAKDLGLSIPPSEECKIVKHCCNYGDFDCDECISGLSDTQQQKSDINKGGDTCE